MRTLKEVTITANRPVSPSDAAVENMSRVVCSLLIKGTRRTVKTPNFWKLSIDINRSDISDDGNVISGVLIVCRRFPTPEFLGWPLPTRQHFMLKYIASALSEVLRSRSLDDSVVAEAARYVEERKFVQVFVGKDEFRGPAGWRARIECEQEMDVARMIVSLRSKDGRRHRFAVAEVMPDEFVIQSYFGKIVWNGSPELETVGGSRVRIPDFDPALFTGA
jgi:hypothetical protein